MERRWHTGKACRTERLIELQVPQQVRQQFVAYDCEIAVSLEPLQIRQFKSFESAGIDSREWLEIDVDV